MLPLYLDLKAKPVLLVGGGPIALAKGKKLLAEGAKVAACSKRFIPEFDGSGIELLDGPFENQPFEEFWLVVAATADRETNRAVAKKARLAKVFCNNAGEGDEGDAIFPLRIEKAGFDVAVTDRHRSPFLLKALAENVAAAIPNHSEEYWALLAKTRKRIIAGYGPEKGPLLKKLAVLALSGQELEEEPDEIIRRLQRE